MNKYIKQHFIDLGGATELSGTYRKSLLTALLFFTFPAITWAADNLEKIFINADQMQMNINSGKSVYTGNVKISQGKLVLTGDKVTLTRSNDEVERITVTGKPARYKQLNEAGEAIEAQSEHMLYIASQNKLTLTINAQLQQPDVKLSSQKIIYDTQKRIVIAGASDETKTTGAGTKQKQRVNIMLTPKKSPADQ
jgi:lipopolysaccharide export system protein LptA